MSKIRLELDFIEIERGRRKWNLYFIIATEHPSDPSQTVISICPQETIRTTRKDENRIDFTPQGTGNDLNGFFVLERDMPEDNSIRARMWVVQSRRKTRAVGEILQEIGSSTEASAVTDSVLNALGAANPWILIGKSILQMSKIIGGFLAKSKDAKKGFVSLDESFTEEELNIGELDRTNRLVGFGEVGWTWIIE
jgi:hypothetical protein